MKPQTSKSKDQNKSKIPIIKSQSTNFGIWNLVIGICLGFWILSFGFTAWAMGGKAPAPPKEEPKYKLEILKMEVVTTPTPSPEAKDLSSKRVLMIIAPKDFQDKEFSTPKELLEAKGAKITVASSTTKTATGMYGAKVEPDIALKDAKATDYDAVIFVGGNGATVYNDDLQALALAIESKKHDKIVSAICIAPVILAKSGILEGKKATVSPYGSKELEKAGATYTAKNVEIDGKIITGKGPAAAEEFGKAIIQSLQQE